MAGLTNPTDQGWSELVGPIDPGLTAGAEIHHAQIWHVYYIPAARGLLSSPRPKLVDLK